MKIGTISLNINTHDLNYGAMLHSWAFQKYLQKHHIETEIIDYTTPSLYNKNLKYPTWDLLKERKLKSAIASIFRFSSHANRFEKFESFKRRELSISSTHYSQAMLSKAYLDYDVIVCESDVVWSPDFFGEKFDPTFFLALPSMNSARKVAYAVSIADGIYSPELVFSFSNLLKNLDAISCRETYAAEYTQRYYSKPVSCTLDPVFLLTADDYKSITASPIIKDPYILMYFPVGYDKRIFHAAKRYAEKRHAKLVEISRYPWDMAKNTTFTEAGIQEFLSLIQHADAVFSNSFHAVCFSIIFEKNFYAFSRKNGNKINDLCKRLNLQDYFFQNEFQEAAPVNYGKLNPIVNHFRTESMRWIEENILSPVNIKQNK